MNKAEETLGARIKRIRERMGYNQTAFSALLNVKQSFLSAVERGVRKAPKNWSVVLKQEYGVSNEYLELGVITKEDEWYVVPKKSTNDGTTLEKVHKSGTTRKAGKKALPGTLEAEKEVLTPQETKRREEGEKWYNRRITESRLYKRYPDAESEGMMEAFAASTIGSDSDRIVRYLHDTIFERIGEVLDKVAASTLTMSDAAEEIKAITAPLDEIKGYFTAIETAIIKMTAAAIERFPGVIDVVGYHVREAIAEAAEQEEREAAKGL